MVRMMVTDWNTYSTADILRLYAASLEELRRRGVLRSANNPSGDYGELLFSRAFGWQLSTYVKHVNAWRIILRDSVWDIPGVQDVTTELHSIEEAGFEAP